MCSTPVCVVASFCVRLSPNATIDCSAALLFGQAAGKQRAGLCWKVKSDYFSAFIAMWSAANRRQLPPRKHSHHKLMKEMTF